MDMETLAKMTYQEVAYEVMSRFLTDFTKEELQDCIEKAYDEKFDTRDIAPIVKADGTYYLELFHGATIAFKRYGVVNTSASDDNGRPQKIR